MVESFAGKVGLITGAASGIGRALALALDREGMLLILVDVEHDGLRKLADSMEQTPMISTLDVSSSKEMETLAEEVFQRFPNLHLLFNNAGVMGPMAPVWELEDADWDWVLGVNVKGVANGIRAFLPKMLQQPDPSRVVNTASEASFASRAFVSVYHASKHAVLALTEGLAQELAFLDAPVRVSVLCPGAVNTAVMEADRNRPSRLARQAGSNRTGEGLLDVYRRSVARGMSPADVADIVLDGIRSNRFYLLPHEEVVELPQARADAVRADLYPEFDPVLAALVKKQTARSDRN